MRVERQGYLILHGGSVLRGDCALVFHFGFVDGSQDLEYWELQFHSWWYTFYLLPKEWIEVYR